MVKYENELINQRLTWLGVFQGLLLAALAFAWDKKQQDECLVVVLCFLGAFVALSCWRGTLLANKAIDNLSSYWDKVKPKDYPGLDVQGVRSGTECLSWLMPGLALPPAFLIAWILIALISFRPGGA